MKKLLAGLVLALCAVCGIKAQTFPNATFTGTLTINASLITGSAYFPPAMLGQGIPSSGTVLYGDGVWRASTAAIPSQTGLAGYFLSTNGTSLVWATALAAPSTTTQNGIPSFANTLGTTVQSTPATLDTSGNAVFPGTFKLSAFTTAGVLTNNGTGVLSTQTPGATLMGYLGTGSPGSTNFLRGDGTWAIPTIPAGGSSTQLQYNNSGALGGTSGLTWNSATGQLANIQNSNGFLGAIIYQNTSVGIAAQAAIQLENNTSNFNMVLSGSGFTGTNNPTGSPSGTVASLYTTGAVPLVLGTNGAANLTFASGGAATFAASLGITGNLAVGTTPSGAVGFNENSTVVSANATGIAIQGTLQTNSNGATDYGELVQQTVANSSFTGMSYNVVFLNTPTVTGNALTGGYMLNIQAPATGMSGYALFGSAGSITSTGINGMAIGATTPSGAVFTLETISAAGYPGLLLNRASGTTSIQFQTAGTTTGFIDAGAGNGINLYNAAGAAIATFQGTGVATITTNVVSPYYVATGAQPGVNTASRAVLDDFSSNARLFSYGPNTSTLGIFEINVLHSDGTGSTNVLASDTSGNLTTSAGLTVAATSTLTGTTFVGAATNLGSSAKLVVKGNGIAFNNDLNGSNNNYSTITNTDTASNSNLIFSTGAGVALTLANTKDATFAGNITVSGATDVAGAIFTSSAGGLSMRGTTGSIYDWAVIQQSNAAFAIGVTAGTNNVVFPGNVSISGSLGATATTVTSLLTTGVPQFRNGSAGAYVETTDWNGSSTGSALNIGLLAATGNTTSILTSYNTGGGTFGPLTLDGTVVTLQSSGANGLTLNSTGVTVAGSLTVNGSSETFNGTPTFSNSPTAGTQLAIIPNATATVGSTVQFLNFNSSVYEPGTIQAAGMTFSTGTVGGGGVTSALNINVSQAVLATSATGGLGYGVGSGTAQVQATSRSTGVTANTVNGQITGNGASLAASTSVTFTVTDSACAATDGVELDLVSGGVVTTFYKVTTIAAGSFQVTELNTSTVTADTTAPVLKFIVHKSVNS